MTREAYFRLRQRPEELLSTAATYILYASYFDRSDPEHRKLYVGQTKDPKQRGDKHEREKTFWTDALVFTSAGSWMNSAHAGALEKVFIEWASGANRYTVTNESIGGDEPLGAYDRAMLDLFMRDVREVVQMAGIDVFEPDPLGLFYFEQEATHWRPAYKAKGRRDGDALVVLAGGVLPAPTAGETGYEFLEQLETDGRVKRTGERVDVLMDVRIPFAGPMNKILSTNAVRWRSANRQKLSSVLMGQPYTDAEAVEPASE